MPRCNSDYIAFADEDRRCCGCCRPARISPIGPIYPPRTRSCCCTASGELLVNGDMEEFTGNVPTGWTVERGTATRVTAAGRTHSGESSLNLANLTDLWQTVPNIRAGCFYEFSLYAHGEGVNNDAAFTATVIFNTPAGSVTGAVIQAKGGSVPYGQTPFGFYKAITSAAPAGVTSASIHVQIAVSTTDPALNPSLDIDDVSFSVQ